MGIEIRKKGNLLEDTSDALVNAVNCVGSSKAGIAKQFVKAFPINQQEYEKACKSEKVKLGKIFVTTEGNMFGAWHIMNFPTHHNYKDPAKIEDIQSGLDDLILKIEKYRVKSISIPALGCGYGKLKWEDVRSVIEAKLGNLEGVDVILYEPRK